MATQKKSRLTTQSSPTTQPELLAALKESGYSPVRMKRLAGGTTLEVHLKPARLKGEKEQFRALELCTAASLQASCRIFPAVPQDILILRVQLPNTPDAGGAD